MTDEESAPPERTDAPERRDDSAGTDVASSAPQEETARAGTEPDDDDAGGTRAGLRLMGAVVTLPWLLLYGVTGVWAVTMAARATIRGLERLDAGYTRYVTPPQLAFVGALLLAAFAVVLACGLLILFRKRAVTAWLPVLLVAAGLTAGAVWAGIEGGLHPLLWVFLFFGLVYATVVALAKLLHATRAKRRDRIAAP